MFSASPFVIECVVVPLLLFVVLFWLRDSLNILHMPMADLVALIVIADVALAFNPADFETLKPVFGFTPLDNKPVSKPEGISWALLAGLGLALCVYLVLGLERRIRGITIHHISVGWSSKRGGTYLSAWKTFAVEKWWAFLFRWAGSFAITAFFYELHLVNVSAAPLGSLALQLSPSLRGGLSQLLIVSGGVFLLVCLVGVALTVLRVFRYSEAVLPWTFNLDD